MIKAKESSPPKWLMGFLTMLVPLCTLLPYLAPSTLMGDMMATLQIDYSLAGMSITIMLVMSGICMFVGSAVSDKIGLRNTLVLSLWLLAAGSGIVFIANSYVVLMLGRICSGIGFGMTSTCCMPFLSAWYEGKTLTYMFALFNAMNGVAQALSFAIAIPIRNLMGSWNGVFGVYCVLTIIIGLLWTFFSKENPKLKEMAEQNAAQRQNQGQKQQSSLSKAIRIKEYWHITILTITFLVASCAVTTFLPTYLTERMSFDMSTASLAATVMSIAGIVGSLLGGVISAQTGRRKPIMLISCGIYAVSILLLTVVSSVPVVFLMAGIMGFIYYIFYPSQNNMIVETPEDPTALSGGVAFINGVPQFVTMLVAPMFNYFTGTIGMTAAFAIFAGILIAGTAFGIIFTKETGPHAKHKK